MERHDRSGVEADRQALEEINLLGEIVSAANAADGPLARGEIDVVLGVSPPATGDREAQ